MLKGDLAETPLADVLTQLAETDATGCLHIVDAEGDEAQVWLKKGLVYSAYVPGRRPQLGARLISSGALAPEALEEALDAQENELQGWRLGELLVHLGYVDRAVVEAFVVEQLRESCFDLSRWESGRFRFRKNEKTREDVGGACTVADLLAEVIHRRQEWAVITETVHGPDAVPTLGAGGLAAAELMLDQDQWALLCKVDGDRSITQLARDCGFTDFEAGNIVHALVRSGLLEVSETVGDDDADYDDGEDEAPSPSAIAGALAAMLSGSSTSLSEPAEDALVDDDQDEALGEFEEVVETFEDDVPRMSRLSSALVLPLAGETEYAGAEPVAAAAELVAEDDDAESGSELSRLLGAFAASDKPAGDEPPDDAQDAALATAFEPDSLTVAETSPTYDLVPTADEASSRRLAMPDPFAASLDKVSAALNALLSDELRPSTTVDLSPVRRSSDNADAGDDSERESRIRQAAAAELQSMQAEADTQRRASGLLSPAAPAADDEPADDEPAADEPADGYDAVAEQAAEAARLEVERIAAEVAAAAEAERLAAEEAARLAAEAEEAARAEAARLAQEEAARAEAERLAQEEAARLEAERLAEAEAQRLEAERLEAEEAERLEAERLEAERLEAERLEAERLEAERLEAERLEAERLEAERLEAERLEAEEAERLETEQLAAEEAERAAAEEAERLAAHSAQLEQEAQAAATAMAAADEAARVANEQSAAAAALFADLAIDPIEPMEQREQLAPAAALEPDDSDDYVPSVSDDIDTADVAAMLRDFAANDVEPPATAGTLSSSSVAVLNDLEDVEEEPAPADDPPYVPSGPREHTDTASLLRELSSLGLDDEPAPTQVPSPSRPVETKDQPKKRKGLFGRG